MNLVTANPKKSLIDTIILNSVSDNYEESIKEWSYIYEYKLPDDKQNNCICGQKITKCCLIKHNKTNKILIVGSTCLLKFMDNISDLTKEVILKIYQKQIINNWECNFLLSIRG